MRIPNYKNFFKISWKYLLPAFFLALFGLVWATNKLSAITTANVFFVPSTSALPTNQIISLRINSGTSNVGFVRVSFAFDKSKINLSGEITHPTPFDTEIEKTSMTEANNLGAARLVIAIPPAKSQEAPAGTFDIAQFPIHVLSETPNDATVFILNKDDIQIVDMQNNPLSFDIENPAYTLNLTAQPTTTLTPTETIIPSITSTITPTTTNTPTNIFTPTNTPTQTLTPSPTGTNTPTVTVTPTSTQAPTATNTPTSTNTPTNTITPTNTQTPIPTASAPTSSPTGGITQTLTPTNTPVPTWTISPTPTQTNGNRFGWFKKFWNNFKNRFSFLSHNR